MNKNKWHKDKISINNELEKTPVPIVADAAIATKDFIDGKLLPLIIIDTSSRPDIEDMINAHESLGPGDADSSWGKLSKDQNLINLVLEFKKPSKCVLILEFNIVKQGIIIDQIVNSKGLYIQYGRKGDRYITKMNHPNILVEIPSLGFRKEWNKIFHKVLEKDAKKNKKMNRSDAKAYSIEVIKKIRELSSKIIIR